MIENTDVKNVERLGTQGREIILVGTAHVSEESARLVSEVIEAEKPDTVCVELCESRYRAIRQKDRWQETDIIKIIKDKKALELLSNLLLASFQKRIAEKFDVRPGEEMIRAIESAEACGARIHLADRDIRITMSGAWHSMGFADKCKVLFQMLWSVIGGIEDITKADIERMKQEDILEAMLSEVGQSFPTIRTILIEERDRYMADKIRTAPGSKIVAVVGAGHVPGIRKYLNTEDDVWESEQIPSFGKTHPLIAAGWVSGLAEAVSGKPKVRDFENLSRDILSIKGFWRNVTRVLPVVAFTNIGTSVGVFVAIPLMVRLLKT